MRRNLSSKGKDTSGSHPVDKVWATLRPGGPVDEILDETRGPRPEIPDLALMESLEYRADIEEAEEALREAQEKGTISLDDLKAELGL